MDVLVWGTGPEALEMLAACDPATVRVMAFVEDDPAKAGGLFAGRKVVAPQVVPALPFDALFLSELRFEASRSKALGLGVKPEAIHAWCGERFAFLRRFGKPGLLPAQVPDDTLAALDATPWYHQVEVFPGVFTPAHAKLQTHLLETLTPEAVRGKRVLDIGAWSGPYTFELERRGAKVTAYDIQDPQRSGFNLVKSVTGSNAEYVCDSVYNLGSRYEKAFDIILFFGVYYHLFNPMLAFTNIHTALADDGIMLFEGAVLEFAYDMDPVWAARKDRMQPYLEVPLAYFTSGDCYGHWSNWYVPNLLCLREWVVSAGFTVDEMYLVPGGSRAHGQASKRIDRAASEHDR